MDKESSKMMEALHNNHLKEHEEYLQEQELEKKQKKGNTLQLIVLIGIGIALTLLCLWLLELNSKDFIEDCMQRGYSENYCSYQINR